jgi:acetylglutamate kinase
VEKDGTFRRATEPDPAMLIVVKYGGNAMHAGSGADALLDDVAVRIAQGDRIVLVHGGGPQIDAALEERGVPQRRVAGLRVTDSATLSVTEAVLCATVNKALVRALLSRGVSAAGISGQDAFLLVARTMDAVDGESLGFVGEIVEVRPALLEALLTAGLTPVVAPLAVTADGRGALNVNADTASAAIAGALGADAYVIVTDVARVRLRVDDPASGIATLDAGTAHGYLNAGIFEGGMRPKMLGALDALARGAKRIVIGDSLDRALGGFGTTVEP